MPPETEPTTEPAEYPTEGRPKPFNWSGEMPTEGRPDTFKSFKTFDDVAKAHGQIQAGYTRSQQELKTAKAELDALKGQKPDTGDTNPDTKPVKDAPAKVSTDEWNEAFAEYREQGRLPQSTLAQLSGKTGLSESDVANFFEVKRQERETYIRLATDKVPGIEMDKLEGWMMSEQSPFSASARKGFEELAGKGNLDWLQTAWNEFQQFMGKGGTFTDPRTQKKVGVPDEFVRGRPGGVDQPGFKSRDEYMAALSAARANNNETEMNVVRRKLTETPEHIRDKFFPG